MFLLVIPPTATSAGGTSGAVPSSVASPSPPPSGYPTAVPTCSACGGNAVRSIVSICREDTWTAHTQGHSVGLGQTSTGQAFTTFAPTSGTTQGSTFLAASLNPPPLPVGEWSAIWPILAFFALVTLLVLWVESEVQRVAQAGYVGYVQLAMLITVLAYVGFAWNSLRLAARERVTLRNKVTRWNTAAAVWERLYYCFTCDRVFDPKTGTHLSPEEIRSRIFPGF